MPGTDEPGFELVEQRVFSLPEDKPLVVSASHYRHSQERPLFDMHYELEIGVVLRGRMRRFFKQGRLDCAPGDVWFCGMWEPHGWQVLKAPCEALVLVIRPPAIANLHFPQGPGIRWLAPFTLPLSQRPRVPRGGRAAVQALAARMRELAGARSAADRLRLWLTLVELLLLLIERQPSVAPAAETPPEAYSRITPAIELAFGTRTFVTNTEAAAACRMSRDRFIRRFRELMGVSFARFALRHRLARAAEQLLRSDDPIKAVATQWGFSDVSHFYRVFAQHYGCTPLRYRRATPSGPA